MKKKGRRTASRRKSKEKEMSRTWRSKCRRTSGTKRMITKGERQG